MSRSRHAYGGPAGAAGLLVAIAVAIGLAAFGVVRGTWAVGGSDSSCYGLMAKTFAAGHLQPTTTLASAPWPNASATFAPGGFIASPIRADAAVPICAPGMSVLMAPLAALFGRDAIFWVTPLAAALLVLSAFAIARQLAGGIAGATAAILVATSPIVLYQTVQPMNDIVTAALWLAAIAAARRTAITGVLIGLAILVRPNLAPLAVVLAVIPFLQHGPTRRAWRSLLLMIAGSLPGAIAMLWLNHALYGSVIASGYGPASSLFSAANIDANVTNYRHALYQTQNVIPAIALLAPFVFDGIKRRGSVLLLVFAAVEILIYLFYQPFPEWWYLRFLIPAIAILLILASAASVHLLSKNRMGGVIPIIAVILGVLGARAAGDRQAFALQRMEGRYRHAAEAVHDRLPANAVLITVWESGSMRFHADREIVMWDALDPAWLDRAITWLKSQEKQPYLLFERREESDFRARFRDQSEIGRLDWPPRLDVNREVRIFDPDDRARYLAGESYATENIRRR